VTVTLSRVQSGAASYLATAFGSFVGSLITLNAGVGGYVSLEEFTPGAAAPGQIVTATVTLSVPAGATGASYELALDPYSASGIITWYTAWSPIAPGETKTLTVTAVMPAGTTSMRARVGLISAAASGRKLSVDTNVVFTSTAQADEIVGGSLTRAQNRTDADSGSGSLILTQGATGPRSGSLTYLCSEWSQVSAIDALYRAGAVQLPSTGPLPAITHYAVGDLRCTLERALPGRPAKWLVNVNLREAA